METAPGGEVMSVRTIRALIVTVGAFAATPWLGAWPAAAAAEGQPDEEVARLTEAIRHATTLADAAKAYARGVAIDSRNVACHRAYMRRLIQLGQPYIARYPAAALRRLAPRDAVAWAVETYVQAKRGAYAEALAAAVMAAQYDPDDPAILNNCGQLVAWYDNALGVPDVPDHVKRAIDHNRQAWSRRGAYSEAYRRFRGGLGKADDEARQFAEQIRQAEADIAAKKRQVGDINGQLRDIQQDIRDSEREIDFLRRDLYGGRPVYYAPRTGSGRQYIATYPSGGLVASDGGATVIYESAGSGGSRLSTSLNLGGYSYRHVTSGAYGVGYQPGYYWYGRYGSGGIRIPAGTRRTRKLVDREEDIIDDLTDRHQDLVRTRDLVEKQLAERELALLALQKQQGKAGGAERHFRWDLPAVGAAAPAPARREAPSPDPQPRDPEAQAERLLKLARLYLHNGMTEKAIPMLKSILKDHRSTAAALEARRELAQIPLTPEELKALRSAAR